MDTKKIAIGVLAGAAFGALLGVLFAPDKGAETRKKVAKRGKDTRDDIQEKFDELLVNLTLKYEAEKEEAKELYAKAKNRVQEIKDNVKTASN
ncbi:MAG: hypothetical protein JWO44_2351 [Bacteroidetes bacterium]|jgi:gas vesicle protein|nr:hypothetical protein [Bacteroidota bacterium]